VVKKKKKKGSKPLPSQESPFEEEFIPIQPAAEKEQ
jgi:hypothetical protein